MLAFMFLIKEHVADNVKYTTKEKYPKLSWHCSSKGISTPFIGTTKGPIITADIYINKCLSQFHSFIKKHHAADEYTGWSKSHITEKN